MLVTGPRVRQPRRERRTSLPRPSRPTPTCEQGGVEDSGGRRVREATLAASVHGLMLIAGMRVRRAR
jgi:hypothetical protein